MNQPQRRPISRLRIAGIVITGLLAVSAIVLGLFAHRVSGRFNACLRAEPVRVRVDLSKAGVVEAPFSQTCSVSHGQIIMLLVEDAHAPPEDILAGLRARIEILDEEGRHVLKDTPLIEAGEAVSWKERWAGESCPLAQFAPIRVGHYTMRLHVNEPAPALAGLSQTLSCVYLLCGMEWLPAVMTGYLAAFLGLAALGVGLLTAFSRGRPTRD